MQKWSYVTAQNPENAALKEISTQRQIDLLDVTPEEAAKIKEGGRQMQEAIEQPQAQPQQQQAPQVNPEEMALQDGIQNKLAQLTQQ